MHSTLFYLHALPLFYFVILFVARFRVRIREGYIIVHPEKSAKEMTPIIYHMGKHSL